MNIYMALSLFSLIILLYWVITELFTILFRFTGLPDEKARFQVISLLTGCGYTTKESEMLLSTRQRRGLARATMLFGYVFNITIVTALINVFLSLKQSRSDFYFGILIPLEQPPSYSFSCAFLLSTPGGIGTCRSWRTVSSGRQTASIPLC